MGRGGESLAFEELLRRRGTSAAGNAEVEREILARYQDDCAVLVLDSSGFTRVTQRHGVIHFLALVVAVRDVVGPVLEEHDALAWWAEADNVYAVFPTARLAVAAALVAQERVGVANASRPRDERLAVCIGVGAGRLLRIGAEDVFGDEMNLAAKLGEDTAGPGEVLVTEAAWERVRDELDGVEAEPCSTRVGGIDLPYQRLTSGRLS